MGSTIQHPESFTMNGTDAFIRASQSINFRPSSFIVGGASTPLKQAFVDLIDGTSWYWTEQSPDVFLSSLVPPAAGTVISIVYETLYSNVTASATVPAAITELTNVNTPLPPPPGDPLPPGSILDPEPPDTIDDYTPPGNSGQFESVVDYRGVPTETAATAITAGITRRVSVIPTAISFKTDIPGLRIGQSIFFDHQGHDISDTFIVASISAKPSPVTRGRGSFFEYSVEAVQLQEVPTQVPADSSTTTHTITSIYPISVTKPYEKLNTLSKAQPPAKKLKEFQVILGSGGDLAAGDPLGNRVMVFHNQSLREVVILPDPAHPPTGQNLEVDVMLEGVSIFATPLVVPAGSSAPAKTTFRGGPTKLRMLRGQILTFSATYTSIGASPVAAQNVTVQFEGEVD